MTPPPPPAGAEEAQREPLASPAPGDTEGFAVAGVRFELAYAPAATFPTGPDDGGTATVEEGFWLGRTEVTYSLWSAVYSWAQENAFRIPSRGARDILTRDRAAPVGAVSWRSVIVWLNALTELVNAQAGTELRPVYYRDSDLTEVIRSADNHGEAVTIRGSSDAPHVDESADGFRLPGADEWSLAARYAGTDQVPGLLASPTGDGRWWTPGDRVSGWSGRAGDASEPSDYAVFNGGRTMPVASKRPNALGLYDMSGNVEELCLDAYLGGDESNRMARGGSFATPAERIGVGHVLSVPPGRDSYIGTGFRIARSR